jgi:hydroxypyruvate isomerase
MFSEHDIQPVFEMINGTDMPRFLVQNIAQTEMLEAVQHPALKMQYDCYHMAMMGEDVLQGYKKIFKLLVTSICRLPGQHEPDTAQIMYANIFEWLQHSSYDGFIAAEYRPKTVQLSPLHGRQNTLLHILKVEPLQI